MAEIFVRLVRIPMTNVVDPVMLRSVERYEVWTSDRLMDWFEITYQGNQQVLHLGTRRRSPNLR